MPAGGIGECIAGRRVVSKVDWRIVFVLVVAARLGQFSNSATLSALVNTFLETLMNGLAVGSLYALIALGYTMVYGILKFINFAHSDVFVVGAWMSLVIAGRLGFADATPENPPPIWVGFVVLVGAMAWCGLLGFTIERFAYRPLRNAPRLNVLITAIGISLLLQNTGQLKWFFGPSPKRMPSMLADVVLNESVVARGTAVAGAGGTVQLDTAFEQIDGRDYRLDIVNAQGGWTSRRVNDTPSTHPAGHPIAVLPPADETIAGHDYRLILVPKVPIRLVDVLGAGTALLLMLCLEWLVFRTKMGRAMRAVSFNHNTAALMGINVDRVISFTFVLGSMLAAAAGFLYALKYPGLNQPAYTTWVLLGLKAFVAAVVGGIGNIRGAMLGGIFIGLIEFFGVTYISTDYRDVYVFSILILVLLFRPSGLLGRATVEKV